MTDDQIDYIDRRLSTVEHTVTELSTTLIGMDGGNGIRGILKELLMEFKQHQAKFTDYVHKERRDTCYGKELVDALREEIRQKEEQEIAKMRVNTEFETAMLQMAADASNNKRTQWVTLGVALLALLSTLVGKIF